LNPWERTEDPLFLLFDVDPEDFAVALSSAAAWLVTCYGRGGLLLAPCSAFVAGWAKRVDSAPGDPG